MSLLGPIHLYFSRTDIIWLDGPFKIDKFLLFSFRRGFAYFGLSGSPLRLLLLPGLPHHTALLRGETIE